MQLECEKRASRNYNQSKKGKARAARYRKTQTAKKCVRAAILRTYGLSLKQYDDLFEQQAGRCKVCGSLPPSGRERFLAVDHCHKTGKIRGLLCKACNIGLGLLREDVRVLRNLIAYIEENEIAN